jgi:hypothetical protein
MKKITAALIGLILPSIIVRLFMLAWGVPMPDDPTNLMIGSLFAGSSMALVLVALAHDSIF